MNDMNAASEFEALTRQLELLRKANALLEQLDSVGIELTEIGPEPLPKEAEVERRRLAAYNQMVQQHNARQGC